LTCFPLSLALCAIPDLLLDVLDEFYLLDFALLEVPFPSVASEFIDDSLLLGPESVNFRFAVFF